MSNERKFYETLKNIFIGAKIEGTGGFINLMKIKSSYYENIEQKLKSDIQEATKNYPNFKEELFDKLYSFFKRYFSENGSIYFHSTPFHNNIYEKVYTNNKDIILFWKTQMLYYIKTDKIFKSLELEIDNFKFFFDASNIENKKANERRNLIYELKEIKEDNTIIFNITYSEKGRITKIEDILKELKYHNINITEDSLENAFRTFERQSEVDFFIHKDAKTFLQEQFKLWSYQYFWDGSNEWNADRVNQLQILKNIAFKIIDFVSQFENELVKIWNKPKFAKNSNYVITLDRIYKQAKNFDLINKIINHTNFDHQLKEWQELEIIDQNFDKNIIIQQNVTGLELHPNYQFLPIDTKYFKDLELEILSLFDDLDNSLDGYLIKSENYQALNTILPKFRNTIQTIYIDPPFNLDSSDQFLYRTNYKDSNWATLLENRLRIAKEWLSDTGSIFVRCDYNGNFIVRCLLDDIFGKENFRNEIVVRKNNTQGQLPSRFNPANEFVFFYSKSLDTAIFNPININKNKPVKWVKMISTKENRNKNWCFVDRVKFLCPQNYHWNLSQENIDKLYSEGKIIAVTNEGQVISKLSLTEINKIKQNFQHGMIYKLESEIKPIDSNWTDIPSYSNVTSQITYFPTENSEILLKRIIESTSNKNIFILDFFLGSGTTTAVAHKLGRKWIGVEMGEHFYTVVLPRMKKVLSYDKSGISKEKDVKEFYNEKSAGGFFKYYELEQYEETLNKTVYQDSDVLFTYEDNIYSQYIFLRDEKLTKALNIDYENNEIKIDLSKLYENIDIPETISNITGKKIKKINKDSFELEDGTIIDINNLDYKLIKPLIWWD